MLPSHGTGARFILYELCLLISFVSLNPSASVLSVIVLIRSAIVALNTRSDLVTLWEVRFLPSLIWHWPLRGYPLPNRFGKRPLNFYHKKFLHQSIGSLLYLIINYYNGISIFGEPLPAYSAGSG